MTSLPIVCLLLFINLFLSSSCASFKVKNSDENISRTNFDLASDGGDTQFNGKFEASLATLGIRQKPNGKFVLVVRIPKIKTDSLRLRVEVVGEQFNGLVIAPKKIIKAKKNSSKIRFRLVVKKGINALIPEGSFVDVPINVIDLDSDFQDQFIIEVRD
jgi:hypothetical protein